MTTTSSGHFGRSSSRFTGSAIPGRGAWQSWWPTLRQTPRSRRRSRRSVCARRTCSFDATRVSNGLRRTARPAERVASRGRRDPHTWKAYTGCGLSGPAAGAEGGAGGLVGPHLLRADLARGNWRCGRAAGPRRRCIAAGRAGTTPPTPPTPPRRVGRPGGPDPDGALLSVRLLGVSGPRVPRGGAVNIPPRWQQLLRTSEFSTRPCSTPGGAAGSASSEPARTEANGLGSTGGSSRSTARTRPSN